MNTPYVGEQPSARLIRWLTEAQRLATASGRPYGVWMNGLGRYFLSDCPDVPQAILVAVRVSLAGLLTLMLSLPVQAQSLRTATTVFAATAAADWTVTGIGLAQGTIHEANPTFGWAHDRPARTVAAGVGLDVAGVWALHRWVAPTHPKVAAVLLYAQAAARVAFVARGARYLR